MTRRRSKPDDIERTEQDSGSLALYAWAGIAALSALTACISVLFPANAPVQIAKKPEFTASKQVAAERWPDIVVPKDTAKLVVATKETDRDLDHETEKLLKKYNETIEPIDPLTTATAPGEVEDVSVKSLSPDQPFPVDDAIGATIGLSNSIPALAARYAALERRAPDLFDTVEPLVELVEGSAGLEARLVAGPFSQEDDLAEFCRAIRLRMTIDCSAGEYAGDPLAQ